MANKILECPKMKQYLDVIDNMYRLGWDERNGGNISVLVDPEEEKEYLGNVIKPFRDRVNYIFKTENSLGEYIAINSRVYTGWRLDVTLLPEFEKGSMYKGMEINKRYNLEELEL